MAKHIKKSQNRPDHAVTYTTGYGVSILQLGKQATKSRKGHRDLYVVLQDSERPNHNKEEAATRATEEGGNGGLNWRTAKESREAQVYMVVRLHSIYRQWSGYEP